MHLENEKYYLYVQGNGLHKSVGLFLNLNNSLENSVIGNFKQLRGHLQTEKWLNKQQNIVKFYRHNQ